MDYEIDFTDISYLKDGSSRQKNVYRIIDDLKIFENLLSYNPILTGTIPLGIDVDSSDIDVICEVYSIDEFSNDLYRYYSTFHKFHLKKSRVRGIDTAIASFNYSNESIGIFGQLIPVKNQYAYRHMTVEYRLLKIFGGKAFTEIKRLKELGYKTEPAFAHYFHIKGDPYKKLNELFDFSDEEIDRFLKSK